MDCLENPHAKANYLWYICMKYDLGTPEEFIESVRNYNGGMLDIKMDQIDLVVASWLAVSEIVRDSLRSGCGKPVSSAWKIYPTRVGIASGEAPPSTTRARGKLRGKRRGHCMALFRGSIKASQFDDRAHAIFNALALLGSESRADWRPEFLPHAAVEMLLAVMAPEQRAIDQLERMAVKRWVMDVTPGASDQLAVLSFCCQPPITPSIVDEEEQKRAAEIALIEERTRLALNLAEPLQKFFVDGLKPKIDSTKATIGFIFS